MADKAATSRARPRRVWGVALGLCAAMATLGCDGSPVTSSSSAQPSTPQVEPAVSVERPAAPEGVDAAAANTDQTQPQAAPAAGPAPADGAQIEALIGAIQGMTPPQKLKAYTRLVDSGQAGLDEVFLVGINEDDPEVIRVVVSYFERHHPPEAIEPLIEVLLFVQGDTELRTHIARSLASFGAPALGPIMARIDDEPRARLAGGALKGFVDAMSLLFEAGGPEVLNAYLERAGREELRLLVPVAGDATGPPLPADEQTIALIIEGLGRELKRPRPDTELVDVWLQLICRVGRHETLPEAVNRLPPLITEAARWSGGLWDVHAAALLGDASTARAISARRGAGGLRTFWTLQAIGLKGDDRLVPTVVQALGAGEPDVVAMAAWSARHQLWAETAPALRLALGARGVPPLELIAALGALHDASSRPALEAQLAGAPREVQAAILRALLPMGDQALARRVMGWLELELLAPGRAQRVDLASGPSRAVAIEGLALVAAHGGPEARPFVGRAASQLGANRGDELGAIRALSASLERGLAPLIRETWLVSGPSPSGPLAPLGETLMALAHAQSSPAVREAVEAVLRECPSPQGRLSAAHALYHMGTQASVPALTGALADPYFVAGPFPVFEHPVRRVASRALARLRVPVEARPDRSYHLR